MGKKLRQTNVSGLSHFLQAFVDVDETASTSVPAVAGPSIPRPAEAKPEPDVIGPNEQLPIKKHRTGLLGPGNEAYDATGLVPFYKDAAQVPLHLQKCTHTHAVVFHREILTHRHPQISPSGYGTSQGMTRDAFWTRKDGTA